MLVTAVCFWILPGTIVRHAERFPEINTASGEIYRTTNSYL